MINKIVSNQRNGALGLIFNNNYKEILFIKRRDIPIWVLPGGGIEDGETPEQAAIREVFEETGYHVEIIRKIGQYTYSKGSKINYTFECLIKGGEKTLSNESKDIEYFSLGNLPEMISPYTSTFIEDALSKNKDPILRKFTKLPSTTWMFALKHPFAFFKYLLTRIGIHWNT